MPVILNCKQCEIDFKVKPSHADKRVYCSMECKKNAQIKPKEELYRNACKKTFTCKQCDCQFEALSNKGYIPKFCSRRCASENKKKDKRSNCKECGVGYLKTNSNQKYCSVKCSAAKRKLKEKPCKNCGELFKPYIHYLEFCSVQCSGGFKSGENNGMYKGKIKTNCLLCDCEFETYPSLKDRKKFCSKKCLYKHMSLSKRGENCIFWRGGTNDYRGENWSKQRDKALVRDNHNCQECGISEQEHIENKSEGLSVHHKVPFRFFDNYKKANDLTNLVSLCRSCHSKQESHQWTEYKFSKATS